MSTTTPNFGWQVPTSTDYVKDGAVAIETLGDAIDASLADLKGGTTGQVLSKATNTDMDFVWVTQDDADAIQNSIIDAKGDLIVGTAADTPAILAVGTNGQILQADSTAATGVKWATPAPGGGMTLIATATPSAATTVSFTSIPTTYKNLVIQWTNVFQNVTNGQWFLRFNNDAGVNYSGVHFYQSSTNSSFVGSAYGGTDKIEAAIGFTGTSATAYNNQAYGVCTIWNAADGAGRKMFQLEATSNNGNANFTYNQNRIFGSYNSSAAITQIDLIRSGTQTITGTIRLYGIN